MGVEFGVYEFDPGRDRRPKKERYTKEMKRLSKLLGGIATAAILLQGLGGLPVHAAGGVYINSSTFPDASLRSIISGRDYDADGNGYLSPSEISRIKNLHCENSNVYSLQGIEYLSSLEGLWCLNNHISSMDLSGNPELKGIWCSHNDFTSLDFTGCPKLEWVYCYNCQLTSINVRNNPELAYIECNANPNLHTLDFSQNTKLENIFASSCGLTSIDVSNCPRLCELAAFKNNLTSLNLSNNPLLKRLDIWDNENLAYVDISNLSQLEYYNVANTAMTSLDMSANPQLMYLVASYNEQMTSINIRNNPRLCQLHLECDYNLGSLDLSGNPQLYFLQAFGMGNLNTLDISNNPFLIAAYQRGVVKDETSHLGAPIHSYTINYGGSLDPFDVLMHMICKDDDMELITTGGNPNVNMSYIDTNDGHSGSEQFATRGQAIQLLYEMCGSPAVSGSTRFVDVAGTSYESAVKWGQDNNICFGYPNICADTFCPNELITKEDFALMAHRVALYKGFGTACDYGRTDWFNDFLSIDFYAWVPFTWAVQWEVVTVNTNTNCCYPHGRMTMTELQNGANKIFNLNPNASYSAQVNGNGTADGSRATFVPYSDGNTTGTNPYTIDGTTYSVGNTGSTGGTSYSPVSGGGAAPAPAAGGSVPAPVAPSAPVSVLAATQGTVSVNYCTHVQNIGWQDYVYDGSMAGTTGESLRLEAMVINVDSSLDLGVQYRTHIQNVGWETEWKNGGTASGSEGQSLRLEAMQIQLTGTAAANYDIWYRVHVQNIGWMGWVCNGEVAGTEGQSLRLEGMEIKIVPKGQPIDLITYDTHVENIGWQAGVTDGAMAGTTGQSLRLEGIHINVVGVPGVGVEYRTHVQNLGWEENWTANGGFSGTEGQSLRLEAIEIRLTGENAGAYTIWYRTHVQNFGWTGWACNGQSCGSAGYSYRLEGIEIVILPAGTPAPGTTANPFYQA